MRKQCRYFVYVYLELILISILLSFDHALAQPWNERASGADSFSALGAEAYQAAVLLATRATAPASTTASASDSNSVSDSASDPNSISDSVSDTTSRAHWDPHGPTAGAAGPRRLQQADTSGAEATPSSPGTSDQGAPPPPLLVPLLPYGLSNQVLALKEALALAAVLNWTVASFGFWPHSSEVAAAEKAAAAAGAARRGGAGGGGAGGGGGVAGAGPGALAAAAALAPIIPFDLVFSRESLAPVVRVLGWEEAVATQQQQRVAADSSSSGSSRNSSSSSTGAEPPLQVEGVVSLSPLSGFSNTLSKASASGFVAAPKSAKTLRNHGFKCDAKGLQWLRNALAGGSRSSSGSSRSDSDSSSSGRSSSEGSSSNAGVITWSRSAALFSYRRVVPPARSSYRPFANDTSPCARAFHQVTLRLARSDLVTATARDFVAAALLGSGGGSGGSGSGGSGSGGSGGGAGGGAGGGGDGRAASEGSSTALQAADASAAVRPPPPVAPYYVALHVRPYPDSCMDYFVNMTTFDLAAAKKVCRNPRLLAQMVPLVRQRIAAQAAAAAGAGAGAGAGGGGAGPSGTAGVGLFVMSHPRVRDVVRRELRRLWAAAAPAEAAAAADPASDGAGSSGSSGSSRRQLAGTSRPRRVGAPDAQAAAAAAAAAGDGGAGDGEGSAEAGDEPAAAGAEQPQTHDQPHYQAALPLPRMFFIDVADLPRELRHHLASTSILSLVEQQVCAGADVFIGTASSSISVMVAQERTAADWEASARGEPSGRVTVLL